MTFINLLTAKCLYLFSTDVYYRAFEEIVETKGDLGQVLLISGKTRNNVQCSKCWQKPWQLKN